MNKSFASDNYSGVHHRILEKLMEVNVGHVPAYGADSYTEEAKEEFRKVFGDVEVFFVFNGTGSNVLALQGIRTKHSAIICPESAHIMQDETGAPSKITGMQLLPVPSPDGKLNLEEAKKWLHFRNSVHKPNADIISISQTTEFGTVYSIEELKAITAFAKEHDMVVHMDGARIANAAVSLGCSFKEITTDIGIDVLSFGGTKNGLMTGEAIVFFNKELAKEFELTRKQHLQLASKLRFLSSQFIPYLGENLWYENAKNANDTAVYLKEELEKINITVTNDVRANAVFAILPEAIIAPLQEFCYFYVWNQFTNEVRFVTSFDSTKEDVDMFIQKIKDLLK